jgi:hypothetical protein
LADAAFRLRRWSCCDGCRRWWGGDELVAVEKGGRRDGEGREAEGRRERERKRDREKG